MSKPKIGITIGDINGIGPEVIIKALSNPKILELCTPIIYGSSKVMSYHKNIIEGIDFNYATNNSPQNASYSKINIINCWNEQVDITLGSATLDGGKYAYIALDRATQDCINGDIDAIVTAPINKQAMQLAEFPHVGHTEFLAEKTQSNKSLMMMVSDTLKVALVTNHLPISKVVSSITKETVTSKLNALNKTLMEDFGIEKPIIAVLGLNPHAGDDGVIGTEDEEILRPIIIEAKKQGVMVTGPHSADGFFGSNQFSKVDAVLAMYHDQGLVAFKALSFGSGVNYTAGLPIIRTSPDHGTAFNIAGQNQANAGSLRSAIYLAIDAAKLRKQYKEDRANPVKPANIGKDKRGRDRGKS